MPAVTLRIPLTQGADVPAQSVPKSVCMELAPCGTSRYRPLIWTWLGDDSIRSSSMSSQTRTQPFPYLAALAIIGLLAAALTAQAQTFSTIYNFSVGSAGEGGTTGPLLLASSGDLSLSAPSIYAPDEVMLLLLTPPSTTGGEWFATPLLSSMLGFGGGLTPSGGDLFTPGGASICCGAIAEISVVDDFSLELTTIFAFTDATTGYGPNQLLASQGNLFGTAELGGSSNMGTIFELTPPASGSTTWGEQTLHTFTGPPLDGRDANGPLVLGPGGVFYGTTIAGGASDNGTVFSLSPPASPGGEWTEKVIYNCTPASAEPTAGLVVGKNGVLYGTSGGVTMSQENIHKGSVFALHPPTQTGGAWSFQTLHAFTGEPDGNGPVGTLVMDKSGALYGATFSGGASNKGMVFKLTPPATEGDEWTETTLHSFKGPTDGHNPYTGLTLSPSGVVYGSTNFGGNAGFGVVYQIVQ